MMPVIRINDATFSDLKSISTWFGTKTPTETIDRIVREAMDQLGLERDDSPDEAITTTGGVLEFDTAPGLSFTKPLAASIGGKAIPGPRWSSILLTMIGQVKARGKLDAEQLARELNVPAKASKFEDEGYKYHRDLGISVQGQSASDAWKEVDRLAKKWRIPVSVEFWWRQNPKAQHPGRSGRLTSGA